MANVIGHAGYPAWNSDETKLLGFAIPMGANFHVYNTVHEKVGEHWTVQGAVDLLTDE